MKGKADGFEAESSTLGYGNAIAAKALNSVQVLTALLPNKDFLS